MPLYLLDTNVIRELGPGGHKNVQAWIKTIDDSSIRISAISIQEIIIGWERKRNQDPARAKRGLAQLQTLKDHYSDRIISVDAEIASEWGRLVAVKGKHHADMALAATARMRHLILVTRNVDDFRGRGVRVLNPFKQPFTIEEV